MSKIFKKRKSTAGQAASLSTRVPFSKAQLTVYALLFAAIGGYLLLHSLAAGVSTANIWVDTTGGSCNRSASQAAYVDANACGDLTSAVAIASPGDVIGWKGGTYGGQTIASNNSLRNLSPACDPYGQWGAASSTSCVKIVPAAGETINMTGNIEIHASSIWLNGAVTNSVTAPQNYASRAFSINVNGYIDTEADSVMVYPEHVVVEGAVANNIGSFSSTNIMLKNLNVGPSTLGTNCTVVEAPSDGLGENAVGYGGGITVLPTAIIYDGLYIHDQTRNANGGVSDCHDGGLFLKGTSGFTLRNSVFQRDAVYDIQEQDVGSGSQPSNVTVENNWFGCPVDFQDQDGGNGSNVCDGQGNIQFNASGQFNNHLYRFNSLSDGFSCSGLACTFSNARFIGNAGSVSTPQVCAAAGTFWDYNAWVGTNGSGQTACGGNDVSLSSGNNLALLFTNIAIGSIDFHLVDGTNLANNLVTPTTSDYSLSTDIDGGARTAPRDAGSDEFGAGSATSLPGDLNNDNVVNVTDLSILLTNWNSTTATADINKDGITNIIDLSILLSNYGRSI